MSTKKPKYNVKMFAYCHSTGYSLTKAQYFEDAIDAAKLYLMMMEEHRHNVPDNTKVHFKLRTASTVLAQFWMQNGASMVSSVDKRIAQDYKAAEQYLASKAREAA